MRLLEERELGAAGLKELVLAAVEDRKGVDVVVLDVSELTDVTDYMVVVGGTSNRHVKAIVDHVLETVKSRAVEILGVEGRDQSDWVLLDLADVVIHVMRTEARAFYDLERLWEVPSAGAGERAGSETAALRMAEKPAPQNARSEDSEPAQLGGRP